MGWKAIAARPGHERDACSWWAKDCIGVLLCEWKFSEFDVARMQIRMGIREIVSVKAISRIDPYRSYRRGLKTVIVLQSLDKCARLCDVPTLRGIIEFSITVYAVHFELSLCMRVCLGYDDGRNFRLSILGSNESKSLAFLLLLPRFINAL